MSKVVKIHLPAGHVSVLKKESRERKQTPIPVHGDTFGASERRTSGNDTDGQAAFDQLTQVDSTPMDDIEQQLKDEFKAGFDEGRRHTEKNLRDDLNASFEEVRRNAEAFIAGVQGELARYHDSLERNAVTLALAIAERLVKREIRRDDEVVLRQIHEAMRRIIGVDRIKIRINPADEEIVRQSRVSLVGASDSVHELAIEADENIERGGCILESDSGNVDALIATQIEKIEAALFEERPER